MRATKGFKSATSGFNKDILAETGGQYDVAFYQLKEQHSQLQAELSVLREQNAKLSAEKNIASAGMDKLSQRIEGLDHDSNMHALQARCEELNEQLKTQRIKGKEQANRILILETQRGSADAENSRMQEII